MPLGTSYPASAGQMPRRQGPTSPTPGTPSSPSGPQGSPTSPTPGTPTYSTPATSRTYTPQEQLIRDFNAINTGQSDALQAQWLNAIGMGTLGYENEAWYRNAQAGNDLARLGLQEGREVGLGRERNAADRGFAQRGFDIDSRGNTLQRDMRYRANDSEAAGRGSITSFGYGQNERDILGQYGIAQDTTQLTFDKKISDLNIDDKALDSLASDFGIRRSDINNALKYGMTQIGLDWTSSVQELNAALASGDAQLAQNALNFMTQVMALPMDTQSLSDLYNSDGSLKINPMITARETQTGQLTPGDRPPVQVREGYAPGFIQ